MVKFMFMIFLFKPLSILFFAAFWFNGRDATFFCQYIANILVKGNENKEDLKAEYQKNLELASKLKSLATSGAKSDSSDPMIMRIQNLKQELKMAEENASSQIALLRGSKGIQRTSSATEASALRRELEMLRKEQEELIIIAKESWVVASVAKPLLWCVDTFTKTCTRG